MQALWNKLRDVNVGAFIVMGIVFLALLLTGANSAANAALLSATLLALLVAAILFTRRGALLRVLAANIVSVLASILFVALAIFTAFGDPQSMSAPQPWSLVEGNAALSLSPYRTLEGVVAFFGPMSAFLLGALFASDRAQRDWSGRWAMVLAGCYCFAGLYLFYAVGGAPRLDVGVGSANAAGALFGTMMVIAATLIIRSARGRLGDAHPALEHWGWAQFVLTAPFSFAVLLASFACLLLTASRGGLIATGAAFLVFVSLVWTQGLKHDSARGLGALAPIVLVAIVLAVLFVRGGDDVLARFALAGEDWQVRQILAETHYALFLQRPLTGHGLNTYHELNALVIGPDTWRMLAAPGSVHNIFVQALEETGLVGLGLWVLMLAPLLTRALMRIVRGKGGVEWAAAALAMSALLLLHGVVDFALQVPAIAAFYAFMLGSSVGAPQR
ncbi:MAG: O-antigen ligase family protein [Hyphomonadaceae bacterium]|nr:O-antigen ligase family protein [Hyphomonadaceae bacterium]